MNDINALFDAYGKAVYSFCLYLAKNKQDGEDLFQETMIRAMELITKIDNNNNPKSYLLSIAVNLWKNTVQKRARRKRIAPTINIEKHEELLADNCDVEAAAIAKETNTVLAKIISALDDKYRIPIILHYSEDMKITEIAAVVHKPEILITSR